MTANSHRLARFQGLVSVFLLLFISVAIGWLSVRYHVSVDWTSSGRHSLAQASIELVSRMDGPIAITAYAHEDKQLRSLIRNLVDRYSKIKPDIELYFVNPDAVPNEVRQLGIRADGELVIHYQERVEHLQKPDERGLTNVLQSLVRGKQRWIAFLEGHGEQDPFGQANHDLRQWVAPLSQRGFKPQTMNLARTGAIPDNTAVLIIANPQVPLLPAEVDLIVDYVNAGGNLLWLVDPGSLQGLEPLAEELGVHPGPGTVVDPGSQLFGIDHPAVVVISRYGAEAPTTDFSFASVFGHARPLEYTGEENWSSQPLLRTSDQAWAETGKLAGAIDFASDTDLPGPLDIGISLTRRHETGNREQRVVIIGDGDFLSNAYLGNSGNMDLGNRILNWLAEDDELVDIPARMAPDLTLELEPVAQAVIGIGFLIVLPLLLVGCGLRVWLTRRKS